MRSAAQIVGKMGGPSKAADAIGVHRTRVHDWIRSGAIPARHWPTIISATSGEITADDLLSLAPRPSPTASDAA